MLNGCVVAIAGNICTEADLLAVAGQRSFDRGTAYLDAVDDLTIFGDQITASVRGTDEYIVMLTLGGSARVTGTCDCPYGQEGFFCKHCVAVGLAFLRDARSSRGKGRKRAATTDEAKIVGLHSWLNSLSREHLLMLVLDQLVDDDDWRRRLELRAATAAADVEAIVARLYALLDPTEFGDYGYVEEGEARRYARRVETAAAIVDDLVSSGNPAEAVAIAEYAITTVAASYRWAFDPASAIWDAGSKLIAIHLAASAAVASDGPDPGLPGFLAERMLSTDDFPDVDIASYLDPLGTSGLEALRESLTTAWQEAPDKWQPKEALADLLKAVGDTDALVHVLTSRPPPNEMLRLHAAKELLAVGRADEAVAYAKPGLGTGGHSSQELADFVVQCYLATDRPSQALDVRRDVFAARRDMASYERLRQTAEHVQDWPANRAWALDLLRADLDADRSGRPGIRFAEGPVLIDVLISEGEATQAWDVATGIASETQWLKLADAVAATRPADALAVYLRQIRALKQETGDRAYERIARLLASARACHARLGTQTSFDIYLRALRADQKRKTKLIRILDAHQLTPA